MNQFISYCCFFFVLIFLSGCTDEDTFKTDYLDFEELTLEKGSYWNGFDGSGGFTSGNKIFYNTFYQDWNTWSGFAYSNVINYFYYNNIAKYASFPSGGADESDTYLVARQFEKIVIDFKNPEEMRTVQFTNTTYTALAIQYGYDYAKKFGGRDGRDPDWFKLTIIGIGVNNEVTGLVDFFLADFRFEDDESDYIVNKWKNVDLSNLGIVKRLEFELLSSDAGTPLYFCMDNLKGRIHF